jgi:hypothetical protein
MQGIDPFAIPAGFPGNFSSLSGYDNSRELDRDVSMMKEMYPLLVRQILLEIEQECDKLEYAGSFMFDEVPDKTLLTMLTDKIYRKVAPAFSNETAFSGSSSSSGSPPLSSTGFHAPFPDGGRPPLNNCPDKNHDCHPDGSPNWLFGLINVLLCSEMCDRRRRYRRRKNMFFF